MLDSWTITGRAKAHALANAAAAEKFWSTLPRDNPFEMQRRLCNEVATGAGHDRPDADRFRALRQLDRHAVRLLEAFLSEYAALGGQSTALERQLRHAALELSRTFADEFERFLRIISKPAVSTAWRDRSSELAVRLFRHREIELVLVLSRYERWPRGRWKTLHDTYKLVFGMDVATRPIPLSRRADATVVTLTPEHGYLRVLMVQLMDGGRFRPEEIAWARRQIGRWSEALTLERLNPMIDHARSQKGFVVNLAGTGGLARMTATETGDLLWLDATPIARAIDAKMEEGADAASPGPTPVRSQLQLDLLRRLRDLYAPQRVHVKRRGERTATVLTSAEATLGDLQTIFRMLRDEARREIETSSVPMPYADEITITDVGSTQRVSASQQPPGGRSTPQATWHIRDRSESGTRLRGRMSDARLLMPGLLIAFRDEKADPWTVAVVRRATRLMGNNVELGVEHLGRAPQRVILLSRAPDALETDARPDRIPALYLPESETCPKMPIRTLLMPTCEFAPDRVMTMRSKMDQVGIRLKEPLERRALFVWTSFDPIEIAADR